MDMKIKFSMGLAAVMAAGSVAFVPASADSRDDMAYSVNPGQVLVLASAETPAEQVWDMTYGAERPALVVETQAAAEEDAPIVDYSVG